MKYAYGIFRILQLASSDVDGFVALIVWLIVAAIECGVISLVVAGIAKLCDKDFEEWFAGTFAVVAILEIINGLVLLFS